MIVTEIKIGAATLIAGMLIFYSGWVNMHGLIECITYAYPPPPDAVSTKHYYQFSVRDFQKIAIGLTLISVGATLILRYTFVRRMQTLGQSYPYKMD